MTKNAKILGVDLGTRKTGLAYSDESGILAFSWKTIEGSLDSQLEKLVELILPSEINLHEAPPAFTEIVFGLPSQEGEWKAKIQAFTLKLKSTLDEHFNNNLGYDLSDPTANNSTPLISFFDEDFSSFEAGQNLAEIKSTLGKKKRQQMDTSKDDAEAARVMLQRFLDSRK